ncbi:ABC transporter ATP-binding protein [Sphingobacterium sp. SRCM116780]|uniref:ABC transporter ATP-binding protein n=1 Tax=Sphingobacterium sp. SRCM116780 TaxID=2907623 RepID=UPI001F30D50D|nr:ABC transporter ATP-binding protein [Sphingobacterium sp. SRCM116780]UIR56947.1 ABC transporter ATP-binding protein [Sphingobacterium sp. SRCM116780]
MITIKNLNFSYSKTRPLFKDMDLQLMEGHIYGLLGKNGAGKSTLLKNIAGLVYPVSGTIEVLQQNPCKRDPSLLQEISFIPEEFYLPAVKSEKFVKANAIFYPKFDHRYFKELIEEFEIPVQQKLADMSYGQKKKYIISFGLASNTKIIIMDEPTNGLDIPSKVQFRKIMASAISEERCVIISTHQVRDLENLIDAVILLDDNRVALNAPVYMITDRICFKKVRELDDHVLYAEPALGGYNTLQKNTMNEDSKLDLEILFNAVLQKKELITNLLTITENVEPA